MPSDKIDQNINKHFEFGAKITKAYFNKESNKHCVKAIASDTGVDGHGERFSEKAIDSMVNCINNRNPSEVLFLPTHWDTFEIGKVTHGKKIDSPDLEELKALEVEIELDMEYPESKALYKEVENGNPEKQLSVGGYLNPDSEKPYYWESKEYETEDGNKLYDYILVLDDVLLDHIAATRKDKAANGRTSFLETVAKSLGLEKPNIEKTIKKEENEMANVLKSSDKQAEGLISAISKSIQGFFAANSESSIRIEKAKKAAEDLNEVLNYYKNSELPKEIDDIMKQFAKSDEGATVVEVVAETVTEATQEVVAETAVQTTEIVEEKVDVEALKSSIIEDVTKSVMESNQKFFEEISKSLGLVIGETIKSQLQPINEKISSIENAAGVSKSIEGQDTLKPNVTKSDDSDESNLWSGFIKGSLPKDFLNKKYDESEGK